MGDCYSPKILLILFILFHATYAANPSSIPKCIESEWKALLEFKENVINGDYKNLTSWTGRECCSWDGITCHNQTGFVQSLDLSAYFLGGRVNPSLLNLKHLEYLDLSHNEFEGLPIPAFLGSLENLHYLNLRDSGFIGEIPPQLGNLTGLRYLSLGGYYSYLSIKSLNWITGLSSLQGLEFQAANLSKCVDWLDSLNKLSSLSSLTLNDCELPSMVQSDVSYDNLTKSLVSVDLHEANVGYAFPPWLLNLTSLEHLTMSGSGLQGPIPDTFGKLTSTLTTLDLSFNSLSSEFLNSLCSLTRLTRMGLQGAQLHASLPICLGNLTSLIDLLVTGNELSGKIPSELGNLTQLTSLDLSGNSFSSTIPSHLGHLQQLINLLLNDNQLTGEFPSTLGNLTNLQSLDVSRNFLTGELSESSLVGVKNLRRLIISRNPSLIFNVSSEWIPPFQIEEIQMDSIFVVNSQPFPRWLREQGELSSLVMRNANISGPILASDAIYNASLTELQLSGNQVTGNIPYEICNFRMLEILSLADNLLTGTIPSCLGNLWLLYVLDLSNNRFFGHIPMELGSLERLLVLHLNENYLSGELPVLKNLTWLTTLDVGKNELQGCIPTWMGKELSLLQHVRLESNNFSCEIPVNICQLSSLHILNLANNNLTSTIPPCLGNLTRMSEYDPDHQEGFVNYIDTLLNSNKGIELEYSSSTLTYSKFISLSGNHLHGQIPEELMNLIGVQSLNLSNNNLAGRIPERINNLHHLESLDLSMNHLFGTIPQSLASIDSLSYLNLSFNNLEGRIPSGNHFDTLAHPSSFEGNIGVCGKLLNRSCPGDDSVQFNEQNGADSEDDDGLFEWSWLYAGAAPGFVVGFLGVMFILCFNKPLRYAYFRFVENVNDRVWVTLAIKIPQFARKFN